MRYALAALIAVIFPFVAFAQQAQVPFTIGFQPNYIEHGGSLDDSLNAGTTRNAYGFMLSAGKTLSEVRFYCASKTGTVASTDIHVALYDANTSTGAPNSSLEDKTLAATPTCPGWNDWTGFTTALTAHTQYFLVLRNANGTPASNFAVIRRIPKVDYSTAGGSRGGIGAGWGWNWRQSTDSGSSWSAGNGSGGHAGWRLKFNDSTYAGMPISLEAKDSTNEVYSSREVGAYVTIPSTWPSLRVAGISMAINGTGTAPTNIRYGLWSGTSSPSNVAYTQTAPSASLQNDMWVPLYFSSVQTLSPNTTYRFTVGTSGGGSAGNSWNVMNYTWDSDSNSQTLKPIGLQQSYYNGTSWAEDSTLVPPFQLILDTGASGAFTVSGGGGVMGVPNTMGGVQ
jgi:hypothetical protein